MSGLFGLGLGMSVRAWTSGEDVVSTFNGGGRWAVGGWGCLWRSGGGTRQTVELSRQDRFPQVY